MPPNSDDEQQTIWHAKSSHSAKNKSGSDFNKKLSRTSSCIQLQAEDPTIARLAIRLHPFVPNDPELWFSMVECSFDATKIKTDSTKFGHVLGILYPKYVTEVHDIIVNPSERDAYKTLKIELIKRLSTTQDQNTNPLLEREEIGDRKPSLFLHHLRNLNGTAMSENVIGTLWMSRLPTETQAILATQKDASLDSVTELADANARPHGPPQVAEMTLQSQEAMLNLKFTQLAVNILQDILSTISQEIAALNYSTLRDDRTGHRRWPARSRSRPWTGPRENTGPYRALLVPLEVR
ncbi:hypothetical protein NQ315_017478 [Exocentrus adspersus]|uniref:DUF7041 domain-containing protein n=1 Tax=Exocentrus adspersus TaxID=1586481 RepID=A0AAV8VJJ2_9CUCU|nr:hypothetical protein NQ315_017478 [Exocentrus adspersus]